MNQDNNNNRIYDKIDKIDDKIERKFDRVERRLDNMEQELVIYNEQLKHHIEGVQLARKQNDMLKEYIDLEINKVLTAMEPVQTHVKNITSFTSVIKSVAGWIFKLGGFVGLIFGIYAKYRGMF